MMFDFKITGITMRERHHYVLKTNQGNAQRIKGGDPARLTALIAAHQRVQRGKLSKPISTGTALENFPFYLEKYKKPYFATLSEVLDLEEKLSSLRKLGKDVTVLEAKKQRILAKLNEPFLALFNGKGNSERIEELIQQLEAETDNVQILLVEKERIDDRTQKELDAIQAIEVVKKGKNRKLILEKRSNIRSELQKEERRLITLEEVLKKSIPLTELEFRTTEEIPDGEVEELEASGSGNPDFETTRLAEERAEDSPLSGRSLDKVQGLLRRAFNLVAQDKVRIEGLLEEASFQITKLSQKIQALENSN